MSKPTIAVDIDDVLAMHYESLVVFHNERYGTELTLADYISDHWSLVWKTDEAETHRRAVEFAMLGVMDRRVKPGSPEALAQLKDRYDLVTITVRRKINIAETYEWLETHFPGVFRQVRFVHLWEEDAPSKAEICLELGATYLIDDSLKHCKLAAELGVTALLFGDYAWNAAKELPTGVTRVSDWTDVLAFFDRR
jgi:5'(3')-deoxyribonucleotidase